jgi:1-aminocyclopropane-1-carboxylate deaminase/D-cysteine desulfhydrase-like pyridoxal-dependent ACC family enzyme
MTAAAACRLGLRCVICFSDVEPPAAQGNLLLDQLFGAECRFFPGTDSVGIAAVLESTAAELSAAGRQPYIIPVGGSTAVGVLGYVDAVRELAIQCDGRDRPPEVIVAATGSCGTLAGLHLGAAVFLPGCQVVGVSVSRSAATAARQTAELATETAALLGVERRFEAAEVSVFEEWIGPGYGAATPEANAAVALAARTEGLLLDPVYTGKAAAGLAGLAARGELGAAARVLFWHTGGAPALFARPETVAAVAAAPS